MKLPFTELRNSRDGGCGEEMSREYEFHVECVKFEMGSKSSSWQAGGCLGPAGALRSTLGQGQN